MEYPKNYTLRVSVENKQQEDAIFNNFTQDENTEKVGKVSAISRDDLFKENHLFYKCFSERAINKLVEAEKNGSGALIDLQCQIEDCIDGLIEDLESK
ncbi:TPA: hypothetical protein QB225_002078 [Pasteurella multocida]|nr:hypothetical protein [Pasteurella multocida]